MPESGTPSALTVVTGAGGFIGQSVCRSLAHNGEPFIGILRPGARAPTRGSVEWPANSFVQVDVSDTAAVADVVRGAKPYRILNLAAVGTAPDDTAEVAAYHDVNVRLPLQLYEAMLNRCTLVQVGSMAQYLGSRLPLEEDLAARDFSSLYSWSKNTADLGLEVLSRRDAVQAKCCIRTRVFGVIGPGERAHRLLPSIIAACRAGTDALLSDGSQVRDFLHVEDVAAAILHLSKQPIRSGFAVNVGRGEGRSVRWMAEFVATLMECRSTLRFGARPRRPGEAEVLVANVDRLNASGWRPQMSIEDSLARAVNQIRAMPNDVR
jgi:nucleoside-diphosphate-sugar epimerase